MDLHLFLQAFMDHLQMLLNEEAAHERQHNRPTWGKLKEAFYRLYCPAAILCHLNCSSVHQIKILHFVWIYFLCLVVFKYALQLNTEMGERRGLLFYQLLTSRVHTRFINTNSPEAGETLLFIL